jgi:hypothetical protein
MKSALLVPTLMRDFASLLPMTVGNRNAVVPVTFQKQHQTAFRAESSPPRIA